MQDSNCLNVCLLTVKTSFLTHTDAIGIQFFSYRIAAIHMYVVLILISKNITEFYSSQVLNV